MLIIANLILGLVGALFFLFVLWKKLKEDYSSDKIFSLGLYCLSFSSLVYIVSLKFFSGWWFWSIMGGALVGLSLGIIRNRLRASEALEAFTIASLFPAAAVFLASFTHTRDKTAIGLFFVILMLIVFYFVVDKHYKKFGWYKSGRVGFSGLSTAGVFFLIRSAVSLSGSTVISFVGQADLYISAIAAFICFLALFNRSRA